MKKLFMAVASAMAVVGSAFAAEQWFDAKISTYTDWPTNNVEEFKGTWSNQDGTTLEDNALKVSATEASPLTFEAAAAKQPAEDTLAITSTLTFTPFDTLPAVPEEAKAGVISYNSKFYVVAKVGEGNGWVDSGIAAADTANVTVTFIDNTNVVYQIDESVSTNEIASAGFVSKVCMSGDGAIAGLSATFETKGPTTPPTGGGSVTKVDGEPGVYVVQPDYSSKTVTIVKGLKDTDTIRVTTKDDITVMGVPANQIQVKIAEKVIPNGAFVGGDATTGFSTALNPEGEVDVESETIKVKPELSEAGDPSGVEPFVLGDDAKVGAKTIPGLTYTLIRQSAPKGGTSEQADQKVAESARTELTDSEKPTDKAFYIIQVTK